MRMRLGLLVMFALVVMPVTADALELHLSTSSRQIQLGEMLELRLQVRNDSQALINLPSSLDEIEDCSCVWIADSPSGDFRQYRPPVSETGLVDSFRPPTQVEPGKFVTLVKHVLLNEPQVYAGVHQDVVEALTRTELRRRFAFESPGFYYLKIVLPPAEEAAPVTSNIVEVEVQFPTPVLEEHWNSLRSQPLLAEYLQTGLMKSRSVEERVELQKRAEHMAQQLSGTSSAKYINRNVSRSTLRTDAGDASLDSVEGTRNK